VNKRNKLFLFFGSLLGFALILLWLRYIPLEEVKEHIRGLAPGYVVLASISYLLAYFVRSFRWNLILRQSIRIPVLDSWLYAMGGNLVNYLIPIRAGELVKTWFVKRNHSMGMSHTLPSVFIDKTFDTLGVVSVIILLPFLTIRINLALGILLFTLLLVSLLSLGILLVAAWRKDLVMNILSTFLRVVPLRFRAKVAKLLEQFVQGLNLFEHKPWMLISALLLTALGIFLDGLYFYLLFVAFGIDLAFVMVLFGYTLINLSYALPQPPAQLGSNEWMMIIIFSLGFSLTKSSASAIMAFAHILTAFLMGLFGSAAFAISGYEVIRMLFKGEKIDG